jgi:adenylate cyclase
MGVYNAPEPQANHAWRAVTTASRIQNRMAKLAEVVNAELGIELQVGIGVNTGQAVVGTIGPQQAMNFTVIGDAVNVAQRLQASAQGGEVLISEDTYLQVGDIGDAEPLEPLTVKGRVRPVPTYRLTGARTGDWRKISRV